MSKDENTASSSTSAPTGTPPWADCPPGWPHWIPCPIIGTGPTFPVPPSSVGQIHGSELRKALRRFKAAKSDKQQFLKNEIGEFCAKKLLQESERRILEEVVDLTFKFDDGERDCSDRIRKLYEQLLDDGGSPIAVAITGIAVDTTSDKNAAKGTATADVGGGLVGAGVGAGLGGLGGAVVGGLLGGLATSLAWEVDNND